MTSARRLDHLLCERDRLRTWQSALAGLFLGLFLGALYLWLGGTP